MNTTTQSAGWLLGCLLLGVVSISPVWAQPQMEGYKLAM